MSLLMSHISFFLVGAAMMLFLMGLSAVIILPGIDRWSRTFFIVYFTVLMLYGITGMSEGILELLSDQSSTRLIDVFYFFETVLTSLISPLLAVYMHHCCGEDWRNSRYIRLMTAFWLVLFVLLCISPFSTLFYYATPETTFVRGPLYPLVVFFFLITIILNLIYVIRRRSLLSEKYYFSFLVGIVPILTAVFIQMFITIFSYLAMCIAICAISMFTIIVSDQIEQNMRQQQEIANQRTSLLLLQIRRHFIYNTMMSIYYLCKQDPDKAQQVTLDFTTYLRKNFSAITSEKLIPFSEELEHTRAYLAVEQAQFEDSLFVSYDTPHTDFYLPPLTLQPIVENAVKHGMDPDSEPLHIFIRTEKTDFGSEITVENSGADFEPADDNEPHIALENIQQRLEMMCRGKMAIMPREGGGTIVRITIQE